MDLGDTNIVGDFITANRNMDGAYYRLDGLLIRKTNRRRLLRSGFGLMNYGL
jgi:hypothetical protein